jgi:hypothetical protein
VLGERHAPVPLNQIFPVGETMGIVEKLREMQVSPREISTRGPEDVFGHDL